MAGSSLKGLLSVRASLNTILFIAVFVLPLAVVSIYMAFVASDRFESTSSIIITEEKTAGPDLDLTLLGITGNSSDKDALVLKEFIESRSMLAFLDKATALRSHFSASTSDWITRLSENASFEEFHEYYLEFLRVDYDLESKVIKFSFQSFDRQYSQDVVNAVLARSQQFIDRLNQAVTDAQLEFFNVEIGKSENRLRATKDKLLAFQREHNILAPELESQTIVATIAGLEQVLATKQAEFSARTATLDPSAPQLQTAKREIDALKRQIQLERDRLAGSGSSLNIIEAEYREIQLELEFNTNIYKANLSALEAARLEAARRLKFLITVSEPSLADESQFPDRPYIIVTWAMGLLILYFITSLILAIIREHA